jgi:hypothetical protein
MKTRFLAVALAAAALSAAPAVGQEPPGAVDFSAFGQRLTALEARVKQLEGGAAKTIPSSCPGGCPLVGADKDRCGSPTCPGMGWNGPCPCIAAKVEQRYTVPTLAGTYTEAQLRAIYPTIRFPHDAPAVAPADPFAASRCGPAGCGTTPTTTARTAAALPYSLAPAATRSSAPGLSPAPTSTGAAPTRATGGTTSGCASGNCAAPARQARPGLLRGGPFLFPR